ncbi:DNA polymerase/3'-5' exonuclease PolX [Marivirga salinae]|uniref:DNA polymerase/3'-5' exonuclease PolX n=1 Tax=Marivirga salinarum TaxID=3059078 RepID=A0AA51N9X8_9BACT|nr:DNA polymerase/3'-5' exonuclease PolX [Marivirga sp. BDSF4-3]WMN11278.1 DNA polymerase/3'-5' exonuclease PolX [Marivirga sp. BDSF4-3]
MENKQIIKILKNTAKLMELHGENDFKVKSYQSAVSSLERHPTSLAIMDIDELQNIEGVGKSLAQSIYQINEQGSFELFDDLSAKTPEGIVEMMQLSGFGPKKIKLIWEKLGIENLEDLLIACKENKIAALKGFGDKTQVKLQEAVEYKLSWRGYIHYREAEQLAEKIIKELKSLEGVKEVSITSDTRRKMEVIKPLEILVASENKAKIIQYVAKNDEFDLDKKNSGPLSLKFIYKPLKAEIHLIFTTKEQFVNDLFKTTAHPKHLNAELEKGESFSHILKEKQFSSEEEIYKASGFPFIVPELREGLWELNWAKENAIPDLVEMNDLKGILHNHSTYSDGKNSLEEMAQYCKDLGYDYLGISDHSKTASYANGLQEFRVKKQHEEIDVLNEKLAPFKIFKGIESDILNDGSLDYANDVLESFDFVVASIHSPLSMDEKTATNRLINAIANPFTTILGHPTGRLLLQRKGYPINHKAVIDACAEYGVVIEINAHPWRLDLDWRYVRYALDKGVQISINPDAHETNGYHDMYYGLCVGRKAGLTAKETFNAKSLDEISQYFKDRKKSALSKI